MQKIGNITSTADKNGEWTNGNVAGGTPPTVIDAAWLNTIQRELANMVISGGMALDPLNDAQVLAALKAIFLQSGNNLSEIKASGPAAVIAALNNLSLGTSAKRSGITSQMTGNGWVQIPMTFGLNESSFILQWMSVSLPQAAGSNMNGTTFNWPIPFPSQNLFAGVTLRGTGYSLQYNPVVGVETVSRNQIQVGSGYSASTASAFVWGLGN